MQVVGNYQPSLINAIWHIDTANPAWSVLTYRLDQNQSYSGDVVIPSAASVVAIKAAISAITSVAVLDLDVRYGYANSTLSCYVFFVSATSQTIFQSLYATANATLVSSVRASIDTVLAGTGYNASFVTGTPVVVLAPVAAPEVQQTFAGSFLKFNIESSTASAPPPAPALHAVRSNISSLLGLGLLDVSVRIEAQQSKKRAQAQQLGVWFSSTTAQNRFVSSALPTNATALSAFNLIISQATGWNSSFASGTPLPTPPADPAPVLDPGNGVQVSQPLSAGAIAGIVVGVGAFLAILIVVGIIFGRRFRAMQKQKEQAELNGAQIPEHLTEWAIKSNEIELSQKLGEGSFGAVYKGKYKGKDVAVKKLTANVLGTAVQAFFQEAATMVAVKPSKNVVRLIGMCQELGNISMVMEFVPGGSLDGWLHKHDVRPESSIDPIMFYHFARGIAIGMRHLANANVVHRDLAARNILLDGSSEFPTPKISDFGFSRVLGSDDEQGKTNSTVGPIRWMSPENLSSRTWRSQASALTNASFIQQRPTQRKVTSGRTELSSSSF